MEQRESYLDEMVWFCGRDGYARLSLREAIARGVVQENETEEKDTWFDRINTAVAEAAGVRFVPVRNVDCKLEGMPGYLSHVEYASRCADVLDRVIKEAPPFPTLDFHAYEFSVGKAYAQARWLLSLARQELSGGDEDVARTAVYKALLLRGEIRRAWRQKGKEKEGTK